MEPEDSLTLRRILIYTLAPHDLGRRFCAVNTRGNPTGREKCAQVLPMERGLPALGSLRGVTEGPSRVPLSSLCTPVIAWRSQESFMVRRLHVGNQSVCRRKGVGVGGDIRCVRTRWQASECPSLYCPSIYVSMYQSMYCLCIYLSIYVSLNLCN